MVRPLKKRIEIGEDFTYPVHNVSEGIEDWPSGSWPFLAKRYVKGELLLHLHFRYFRREVGHAVHSGPVNLCAVFERAELHSQGVHRNRRSHKDFICTGQRNESPSLEQRPDYVQELVLTLVGQLTEDRQGIRRGVLLTSAVRLCPLDSCPVYLGQAPDIAGFRPPPTVRPIENGETRAVFHRVPVL